MHVFSDPDVALLAGDWHGNSRWATSVIRALPDMPGAPRLVLHTGDFGYWPGRSGEDYLADVTIALAGVDAHLWFVDGNHEDHKRLRAKMMRRAASNRRCRPYEITDRISWLPRGYRWTWHGRTWLALGGATSVDRPLRREGIDWWPQEALTAVDVAYVIDGGPADVMLTHDCPDGVLMDLPPPPAWWEIEPADRHRRTLREVVERVRPEMLVHGHYHLRHDSVLTTTLGELVRVVGLDCDGSAHGNSLLINTHTLGVTNPWVPVTAGEGDTP